LIGRQKYQTGCEFSGGRKFEPGNGAKKRVRKLGENARTIAGAKV
jgi:hypothetical protein